MPTAGGPHDDPHFDEHHGIPYCICSCTDCEPDGCGRDPYEFEAEDSHTVTLDDLRRHWPQPSDSERRVDWSPTSPEPF